MRGSQLIQCCLLGGSLFQPQWLSRATATTITGWGLNDYGQISVPAGLEAVTFSAGASHVMALKPDGTVIVWGDNTYGQTNVPPGLSNVVAIAAGFDHCLALKADGTLAAWGAGTNYSSYPHYGQAMIPAAATRIIAISGGGRHSMALRGDHRVVAWGLNTDGQTNVPSGLNDVISISAGLYFSTALRSNGVPVAWGNNYYGQLNLPAAANDPALLRAGWSQGLAIKSDGNAIAWGRNDTGQLNIPADLTGAVDLQGGLLHGLAINGDRTIRAWGASPYGQAQPPVGLSNIIAIAAGAYFSLALTQPLLNGAAFAVLPQSLMVVTDQDADLGASVTNGPQLLLQWRHDGANIPGATNVGLSLTHVQVEDGGVYAVTAANGSAFGYSSNASLTVVRPLAAQTVNPGSDVTFSATVLSGTVLTYQWQFNGTDIPGATTINYSLSNAQIGAVGEYAVTVRDRYGGSIRTAADLMVSPTTPVLTLQPADVAVVAGTNATFTAAATGSQPLAFQWRFNGTNITDATDSRLSLIDVQSAIAGEYDVVVTNAYGMATSSSASLTVSNIAPMISFRAASQTVRAGLNYRFSVQASGTEPLAYQWQRGGGDVPGGTGSALSLLNVQPADSDVYRVVVSNSLGFVWTRSVSLNVLPPLLPGTEFGWGDDPAGELDQNGVTNIIDMAAGTLHTLALKPDGSVIGWGGINNHFQVDPPPGLSNVIAISAGYRDSAALTQDGLVTAWGYAYSMGFTAVPSGLSNVVALSIDSGDVQSYTLALRSDGTIVAWGADPFGMANLPPLEFDQISAISAGKQHALALRDDGSVFAWGDDSFGQTDIPSGLSNVIAIAAGGYHSLALRADGTLIGWGRNDIGQATAPPGLSNVVSVAAGMYHSLALRSDGTIAAWGANDKGQTAVPTGLRGVSSIYAGGYDSFALTFNPLNPVPPLNIRVSGDHLLLSWDLWPSPLRLETTTNLVPPVSWTKILTSGNLATPRLTNQQAFFRLRGSD